jgi:hypothetical protein
MGIHVGLGVGIDKICRDNFPLPQELAAKLKSVSKAVHNGRGFVVLRGLNPLKYISKDNVIIYGGVTSYVAEERADMSRLISAVPYEVLIGGSPHLRPRGW